MNLHKTTFKSYLSLISPEGGWLFHKWEKVFSDKFDIWQLFCPKYKCSHQFSVFRVTIEKCNFITSRFDNIYCIFVTVILFLFFRDSFFPVWVGLNFCQGQKLQTDAMSKKAQSQSILELIHWGLKANN